MGLCPTRLSGEAELLLVWCSCAYPYQGAKSAKRPCAAKELKTSSHEFLPLITVERKKFGLGQL